MTIDVTEHAAAKINLALAVTGRRDDGYHLIDTLAVFAETGDILHAAPGDTLTLDVDGPFGEDVESGAGNLVIKAARAVAELAGRDGDAAGGAHFHLTKILPVAAGIGGGSADAAAALRALNRLWEFGLSPERLAAMGVPIGADVAMCVNSRALRARGIGDQVTMLDGLPRLAMVLVNPGVAVSTAAAFAALEERTGEPLPDPGRFADCLELARWLALTRNDLEGPASRLAPPVVDVLAALRSLPDCLLARMSGSGATCFAIFPNREAANQAAARLKARRPDWWVVATMAG